mmetsp:Transcript_15422/g.32449  ORF Transcript_15422/g.32449 Transcript_15422/m.32449 type:complete len:92 (-) Transcript_15422:73-348(-)
MSKSSLALCELALNEMCLIDRGICKVLCVAKPDDVLIAANSWRTINDRADFIAELFASRRWDEARCAQAGMIEEKDVLCVGINADSTATPN